MQNTLVIGNKTWISDTKKIYQSERFSCLNMVHVYVPEQMLYIQNWNNYCAMCTYLCLLFPHESVPLISHHLCQLFLLGAFYAKSGQLFLEIPYRAVGELLLLFGGHLHCLKCLLIGQHLQIIVSLTDKCSLEQTSSMAMLKVHKHFCKIDSIAS